MVWLTIRLLLLVRLQFLYWSVRFFQLFYRNWIQFLLFLCFIVISIRRNAKTKYERERGENVKKVHDVFKSLGILVLAQTIRDVISKGKKGKGKRLVSNKPESDIKYGPSSNIDNQSNSDDDYDDDLNTEVRWITRPIYKFTYPSIWNIYFIVVI